MVQQGVIAPAAFKRTLLQIVLLPVALLAVLVLVFLLQLNSLLRASQLVNHTDAVIRQAGLIKESLLDQQVAVRGYLLTGDAARLSFYQSRSAAIDQQFALLDALIADNPPQEAQSAEIVRTYRAWVAYADTLPATRDAGTSAAAMPQSDTLSRAARAAIDTFVQTEQDLLATRTAQVEQTTKIIIFTSIGSIFVIGGLLSLAIWRQVRGLTDQYDQSLMRSQRQTAALVESEGRFRDLANALPQIVWTMHRDGDVAFVNQRWYDYTGLTPEGATGRVWMDPIHPDDRPQVDRYWAQSQERAERLEVEYRFRRVDGEYRWYLVRAVPVRDDARQVVSWIGSGTDINDQKRDEAALRERTQRLAQATKALADRNRELDQFAYVTSHDLKAPLRGIANLAQWIEEDLGELATGDIRQQLDLLRGRVHRMEALIDGILQFSRIGRVKETIERVDVRELLVDTVDLIAPPPNFTIALGPDGAGDTGIALPVLMAERTRLQQVFANLIGNAVKHHDRADGRIAVQARETEDPQFYEFTVADDGPGIAPQYHERIFGIFQTLRPRDQVEGSGLGLALVKKIVEQYGGRIWLESDEGQGTTFHFTWPKAIGQEG